MRLLRRVLGFLTVAAYLAATSLAPVVYVGTPEISSAMHHEGGDDGGTMPCSKDMAHGCYAEFGCIFLVGTPAPQFSLLTTTAWSSVTYGHAVGALRGRTLEPALGPPIPQA